MTYLLLYGAMFWFSLPGSVSVSFQSTFFAFGFCLTS
jgi:hypothetical protein